MLFSLLIFYNYVFNLPKLIILRGAYINRISLLFSLIFSLSRRTCTFVNFSLLHSFSGSVSFIWNFVPVGLNFRLGFPRRSVASFGITRSVGWSTARYYSTSSTKASKVKAPVVIKKDPEDCKLDPN